MPTFPVHSLDTAPDAAKPLLEMTQQAFGFVPNLIGVMASSPPLAEAYLTISGIFDKTGLTPTERQIVLLTVSHFHSCGYCVAAHSVIAGMQDVSADIVEAIRNNQPIADNKLEALRQFTYLLLDKRGWVTEDDMKPFLAAGYQPSHAMDILVGIAQKTLSNFTNHIAHTPLDDAFAAQSWKPEA